MNKIVEYKIVTSNDIVQQVHSMTSTSDKLVIAVNEHISQGWQPFGGIDDYSSQAMVRYEDKNGFTVQGDNQ